MTGSFFAFVAGASLAAGAAGVGSAGIPHGEIPCCIIIACNRCGGSIGMGGSIPWCGGIKP